MDDDEKVRVLDDIIELLNADDSISIMASEYNVVFCLEELLDLYHDTKDKLQEIHDTVGW